jgi:hypothetical protein
MFSFPAVAGHRMNVIRGSFEEIPLNSIKSVNLPEIPAVIVFNDDRGHIPISVPVKPGFIGCPFVVMKFVQFHFITSVKKEKSGTSDYSIFYIPCQHIC